ncbi:MAG TPA: hypothetical protein DEP22_09610 [Porphyromonadaceae bacterium]|nr:hypothetical protein [Porphyromonadaceae bacterium]
MATTCKEQGVNPREWFVDVMGRMPYYGSRKMMKT